MKLFSVSAFILFCTYIFAQDTTSYRIEAASFDTIRPTFWYGTLPYDSVHKVYTLSTTSVDTTRQIAAQFPGGDSVLHKFYAETMQYPSYALEHKVEGTVYVSFNVEEDGTLTHLKIVETPHKTLCDEALRIVKLMPKWKPATRHDKPISSGVRLPIIFKIR